MGRWRRRRLRQQQNRCFICGEPLNKGDTTKDHLIPKSRQGSNCWNNIVLVHRACNFEKADKMPTPEMVQKFKDMTGQQPLINRKREIKNDK